MAYLWSGAWLAINKKQIFFCYQTTNLLKFWFLILVSTKRQKRDKSIFITKFVGMLIMITIELWLLPHKNLSGIPCKIFATLFFHWSLETKNPLTKQLVECPRQILANYVHINGRAFQLLRLKLCFIVSVKKDNWMIC